MHDDIRRAYAVLGLPPGASPGQLRRRYRALVKTWHPDRFASDPVGQAAASERLAHINGAYRLVTQGPAPADAPYPPASGPAAGQAAHAPSEPPRPHGRLSREEIDRMVEAIGTDRPLDSLFGRFDSARAGSQPLTKGHIALALSAAALFVALEARAGHLKADLIVLAVAAVGVLIWSLTRR